MEVEKTMKCHPISRLAYFLSLVIVFSTMFAWGYLTLKVVKTRPDIIFEVVEEVGVLSTVWGWWGFGLMFGVGLYGLIRLLGLTFNDVLYGGDYVFTKHQSPYFKTIICDKLREDKHDG